MFLTMLLGKALRLFPNVPEIKEKQKKCLNLKIFLDCFQLGSKKACFTNCLKLSVDRPNTTRDNVKRYLGVYLNNRFSLFFFAPGFGHELNFD